MWTLDFSCPSSRPEVHTLAHGPCAEKRPGAQGLAKIDSSRLMARLLGLVAPLIAQSVARGALSTLYTATAPELTGALPSRPHG